MKSNGLRIPAVALSLLLAALSAASATGQVRVKLQKKPARMDPLALEYLQQACPTLVQPYDASGSVVALFKPQLKDMWTHGITAASNRLEKGASAIMNGGSSPSTQPAADEKKSDIPDALRMRAKEINWLPQNIELLYGEREHEQEVARILDRDTDQGERLYPIADRMLKEILAAIKEPHGYDFKVFILKDDGHNAVARPGGFLYIDAGLLKDEKLHPKAHFALAHEIAHVLQRHETMELQGLIIDSFAFKKDLYTALVEMKNKPSSVLSHVKIDKDIYVRHHIVQELQADSCGAKALSVVYEDSQESFLGSLNAFLKDLPPDQAVVPATSPGAPHVEPVQVVAVTRDIVANPVDRHPTSRERTENLQAMYKEVMAPTAGVTTPTASGFAKQR